MGIAGVLKSLLPSDLLKKMSSYEWKKEIVRAHNKDSGMSPDEAKVAFLKVIYRWPTYGSAFFEVTQVSDPNLPANLLVAINKQGLNLIQPEGKEILATLPLSHIMHWASSPTTFCLTVGDSASFSKLPLRPPWPTRWTTCSPLTSPLSSLARTTRRRLLFESQRKFSLFHQHLPRKLVPTCYILYILFLLKRI